MSAHRTFEEAAMRSDFEELCFSVVIPVLVILIIMALISGAESIDAVVWGK